MIQTVGTIVAAGFHAADAGGGGGPATLAWSPLDLAEIFALYNPTVQTATVEFGSGENIATLIDLTSNDHDLPAAGATKPKYRNDQVEIDHTGNQVLDLEITTSTVVDYGHIFWYVELGAADVFGRYIGRDGQNDTGQADYAAPLLVNGTGQLAMSDNGAQLLNITKPTGYNLIEARVEANRVSYWVNGVEQDFSATDTALQFEQIVIGRGWTNSYGASSNWKVLAIVKGTLTNDEIQRMESWMLQQVGQQALLPGSNIYKNTTFDKITQGWTEVALSTAQQYSEGMTWLGGDSYTWTGAGEDLWGADDRAVFYYKLLGDDITIDMYIEDISLISGDQGDIEQYAGAYLMVRESLDADSVHYSIGINPATIRVQQKRRTTTGQSTQESNFSQNPAEPMYLRTVRAAGVVTQYWSTDGVTYNQLGDTPNMGTGDLYIGVAVTSHDDSTPDYIRVTGTLSVT